MAIPSKLCIIFTVCECNIAIHDSVVKELLKRAHQSNFDLIEDLDKRSNTALHFACRLGHYNVAKVLLKAKANPNMKLV